MNARLIYWMLLILTTAFAFFFLGLIFLGAPSINPEALNPYNEHQVMLRHGLYGLVVSLFFALLSLLINISFRKKLSFESAYILRFFLIHFLMLIIIFVIVHFLIY